MKIIYNFSQKANIKPGFLEKNYVYKSYDLIAQHFDHTRFAKWPKVKQFLELFEESDILCDIGCGNGKYLKNTTKNIIGLDRSQNLLHFANSKSIGLNLLAADALKIPLRSQSCDGILLIAVLHHLSTTKLRKKALEQSFRILRAGGQGIIYVWCYEQYIKNKENLPEQLYNDNLTRGQDVLINWHLSNKFKIPKQAKDTNRQVRDKNSVLIQRYYHLFKQNQLQNLVGQFDQVKIKKSFYDKQNWCCLLEKI